ARGELAFGTVDSWLVWRMTGGAVHATDPTNASRTLLYRSDRLSEAAWDPWLLDLFETPAAVLPEVRRSSGPFGTVSNVRGLPDELGVIATSADVEPLARSVPDALGTHFVPAFVGLGAPHWDADARGAWLGLTRGAGRAHLARAVLEAIAWQSRDLLDAVID